MDIEGRDRTMLKDLILENLKSRGLDAGDPLFEAVSSQAVIPYEVAVTGMPDGKTINVETRATVVLDDVDGHIKTLSCRQQIIPGARFYAHSHPDAVKDARELAADLANVEAGNFGTADVFVIAGTAAMRIPARPTAPVLPPADGWTNTYSFAFDAATGLFYETIMTSRQAAEARRDIIGVARKAVEEGRAPVVGPMAIPLLTLVSALAPQRRTREMEALDALSRIAGGSTSADDIRSVLDLIKDRASGTKAPVTILGYDINVYDSSVAEIARQANDKVKVYVFGTKADEARAQGISNFVVVESGTPADALIARVGTKDGVVGRVAIFHVGGSELESTIHREIEAGRAAQNQYHVSCIAATEKSIKPEKDGKGTVNPAGALLSIVQDRSGLVEMGQQASFTSVRNLLGRIGGFVIVAQRIGEALRQLYEAIRATATSV
jgi:hypothetical protein